MDYSVALTDEASENLASLPPADQKKVRRGFDRVSESPFHVPGCTEPLKGQRKPGRTQAPLNKVYKYRTNGLRFYYVVDSKAEVVTVLSVARRKTTTYRKR